MSEILSASPDPSPEAARTLIAERDRLCSWLDQLAAHGDEVPDHVVARVRGDYQERLGRVTEGLGDHLGSLRQTLAELRELQGAAEAQHVEAGDELAEVRLRHLIGELDTGAWDERRPGLEAAVLDAARECTEITAEVTRLAELVTEIEGAAEPHGAGEVQAEAIAATQPEATEESTVDELFAVWSAEESEEHEDEALPWLAAEGAAAGAANEGFDDLEFLREVSAPAEAAGEAGETTAEDASEDLAFLEELDRVIASTAPGSEGGEADATASGEDTAAAAAPGAKAGLACKECGAANDARSWYCEICGMELT